MANIEQITRLALYETKAVVPVQSFPAGVYQFPLHVMGNSLLSSLWVKSAGGATINVRYWDYGAGDNQYPGERVDLKSHTTVTTSDITERIIVTALHDKPRIEIEITGGTAELGVYVTVVATFASDLDASLKLHLQDAVIEKDKGLVVSGYDATLDKFFMLPIEGGKVKTTAEITGSVTISDPGVPYFLRGKEDATPGGTESIFSAIVPSGTTRNLKQLFVTATNDGDISLEANGIEIAAGRISEATRNFVFKFDPPRPIAAGVTIELKYTADSEPSVPCPVTAFLSGSDLT